jgi:hypothetical protein
LKKLELGSEAMETGTFEHPEDELFFAKLIANGDVDRLRAEFIHLFDFRAPAIKRAEFGRVCKGLRASLLELYGPRCLLKEPGYCQGIALPPNGLQLDHIVPLSSNKLNKGSSGDR